MIAPDWERDGISLFCGDCLKVLPQLAAGSVDAVVTDPPFKISQEYSPTADADNLLAVSSIWPVAADCRKVVRQGGLMVLFYDNRILPLALHAMERGGWRYLRGLTLYRRWGNAHQLYGWMSTSDFVLVFAAPGAKPKFSGPWRHDVYVKAKPERQGTGHPAQKPLAALRHIVGNVCPGGGCVLDMYLGSGTTGVACVHAGLRFIGIEKEPKYFDIAVKRIEAALAEKAQELDFAEAIAC